MSLILEPGIRAIKIITENIKQLVNVKNKGIYELFKYIK